MRKALISLILTMLFIASLAVLPAAACNDSYQGGDWGQGYYGGCDNNCGGGDWGWNWDWHWGSGWCPGGPGGPGGPNGPYCPGGGGCTPPCCDVPEPSTLALLGGGLASFVSWVGIRRRKLIG